MITTWGIFWISFFGASVLNTLIQKITFSECPKLCKDSQEKLRELALEIASLVNVNCINVVKKQGLQKEAKKKAKTSKN